jgi:hypothetical protein
MNLHDNECEGSTEPFCCCSYRSDITRMEQQLATKDAAIELYNKALLATFPEGARGEVFTLWNEARKELGK